MNVRGTQASSPPDGGSPPLAFVHIPKTAGGTVKGILVSAYSRRAVQDAGNYPRNPTKTVAKLARRRHAGYRVLVGHVPYGVFQEHLPERTPYMTFLRDPVERVLSHYYRHIHQARATSLEEALLGLHLPELTNLATRFLCGHASPMGDLPASALRDAEANLRAFAFIGLQERFDESLALLQRMLGLEFAPYENRHVSVGRPTAAAIRAEERAMIEQANRLDIELYAFALDLFQAAVSAAGDELGLEVDELRERLGAPHAAATPQ
jgi:hypothetical protein